MKLLLAAFCLVFLVLVAAPQPAHSMPALTSVAPNGTLIPWMSQSEFRICQIRRFFCGTTGFVIIAFAIFCLGILIVQEKMHWAPAILIIAGIIVFVDARQVSQAFGKQVFIFLFIDNPMCDCSCSINMDEVFTNPAQTVHDLGACAERVGTGLNPQPEH